MITYNNFFFFFEFISFNNSIEFILIFKGYNATKINEIDEFIIFFKLKNIFFLLLPEYNMFNKIKGINNNNSPIVR